MSPEARKQHSQNLSRLIVFIILFAFWVIFSGHYDSLHLGLGFVCSFLVAVLSHDLLIQNMTAPNKLLRVWRFLHYVPWLLYQIVLANLHVVALVINPRKIRPQVVRFKSDLTSDLARVSLGNSITLTPGTITVEVDSQELVIHALDDDSAEDITSLRLEQQVAGLFTEKGDR